ncbi:MAG: trypsin-like peptidase domain-containing protein [Clostridia bacterium]|nr:trypsin-like peptidase domain-containing protein [Clostridia bacterium]
MNEFEYMDENNKEEEIHSEADMEMVESTADESNFDNSEENFAKADTHAEFTVTHHNSKKHRSKWARVIAIALVAGIVGGTAFGFANSLSTRYAFSKISIGKTNVALTQSDAPTYGISSVSAIAEECMPSIVAITNKSVTDVMTFFGKYTQESTNSGSGIIIGKNDTELLIVTNYHVIANSKELSVIFSPVEAKMEQNAVSDASVTNKDIPSAVVKGYNSDKDLAVIAVSLKDISPEVLSEIKIATVGDSSALRPGDQIVAIGNALGYGQSVTTGIISAVNRQIVMENSAGTGTVSNSFIQTDAAINPGNSGGALLNMAGEVVGINSVKIAASGVEGMGYAIPISDVGDIIDELMVKKSRDVVDEDKQGFLGITASDVTSSIATTYGIPTGVYVSSVTEGLAADVAGIKKGYVITEFDGYTITTISQLQDRLTYYKSGEKVELKVQIPGAEGYSEKTLTVTLSNRSKNIDKVTE